MSTVSSASAAPEGRPGTGTAIPALYAGREGVSGSEPSDTRTGIGMMNDMEGETVNDGQVDQVSSEQVETDQSSGGDGRTPGDVLRTLPSEAQQRGTRYVSAQAMQAKLFSVYDARPRPRMPWPWSNSSSRSP